MARYAKTHHGPRWPPQFHKGHAPSTDLRYGEEDSIIHITLIVAAIKG